MSGPVPMFDLGGEHRAIAAELRAEVERVLFGGRFVLGPEVEALEAELCAASGASRAVACASGSDALYLALLALGVGPGDEVVTTSFTFVATGEAIARTGARPVFADIDPATFNLDPASVEASLGPRTRAIVPVHLFGLTADMERLAALAHPRRIGLVEDAAQAFGAIAADGRKAGSIGDLAALSFYPTKNLGAAGDAGAVLANGREAAAWADRVRSLRGHGASATPEVFTEVGINSRLDALQAAILRVKLRHLSEWTAARRRNAAYLCGALAGVPGVRVPAEPAAGVHVYNQLTIRVNDRERVRAELTAQGVGHAVYYSIPLHRQPCFARFGPHAPCPEADRAAAEVLSLPVHPLLEAQALARIAEVVRAAVAR